MPFLRRFLFFDASFEKLSIFSSAKFNELARRLLLRFRQQQQQQSLLIEELICSRELRRSQISVEMMMNRL